MAYTVYNLTGSGIGNYSISASALSLQNAYSTSFAFDRYSYTRGSLPFITYLYTALYDSYWSQEIAVYPRACDSATPQQNCTISCMNASVMFSDLEIFHNCLLYPWIADLNSKGTLKDTHLVDSLGIDDKSRAIRQPKTLPPLSFNVSPNIVGITSSVQPLSQKMTHSIPSMVPIVQFFTSTSVNMSRPSRFSIQILEV